MVRMDDTEEEVDFLLCRPAEDRRYEVERGVMGDGEMDVLLYELLEARVDTLGR